MQELPKSINSPAQKIKLHLHPKASLTRAVTETLKTATPVAELATPRAIALLYSNQKPGATLLTMNTIEDPNPKTENLSLEEMYTW